MTTQSSIREEKTCPNCKAVLAVDRSRPGAPASCPECGGALADEERAPRAEDALAFLVLIYPLGPGVGTRYALGVEPTTIGTADGCDIRLLDGSVAERHTQIALEGGEHVVADLDNKTGTFVNQVRVARHLLQDGDYLHVGGVIFRYLAGGDVEAAYHEEIYRLTIMDSLSGIHNRRYMIEFLDRELSRALRHRRPLSLIMCDIDGFMSVNAKYGHLCGDLVLRELAMFLKALVRKEDLCARYGGDEFAIVLPETEHAHAVTIAAQLRQVVERHTFVVYEERPIRISVSAGVVSTLGDRPLSPAELIRQADAKVIAAKQAGRNRVMG